MITVRPYADSNEILRFDGEVYEVFWGDKSSRIHIANLSAIKINTDRKGHHELVVETVVGNIPYLSVDEGAFARVNAMVEEIQKAKATYQL